MNVIAFILITERTDRGSILENSIAEEAIIRVLDYLANQPPTDE